VAFRRSCARYDFYIAVDEELVVDWLGLRGGQA
jgi:hypothetical protein